MQNGSFSRFVGGPNHGKPLMIFGSKLELQVSQKPEVLELRAQDFTSGDLLTYAEGCVESLGSDHRITLVVNDLLYVGT